MEARDLWDAAQEEHWFGILKAKTKRFYNNFPNNSTIRSIRTFLETFTAWYNVLLKNKNLTTSLKQ